MYTRACGIVSLLIGVCVIIYYYITRSKFCFGQQKVFAQQYIPSSKTSEQRVYYPEVMWDTEFCSFPVNRIGEEKTRNPPCARHVYQSYHFDTIII